MNTKNSRHAAFAGAALAAILAFSVFALPSAFAYAGHTKHGSPDFEITDVNGLTMNVTGTAGATVPTSHREVFAYVFVLNTTNSETLKGYAVTSHFPDDSSEVDSDIEWHAHYVEVSLSTLCVTDLQEDGNAALAGNSVSVTGVTGNVTAGLTAILSINSGQGAVCVEHILDSEVA